MTAIDGAALLVSIPGDSGFEPIKAASDRCRGFFCAHPLFVGSHAKRYTVPPNGVPRPLKAVVNLELKMSRPVPDPGILDIAPYTPGKSPVARPGQKVFKLSANETPFGPSPHAIEAY
ncbi:MAG: hypothetical protein MZV49_22325 [Rhodopseudomonas palustris]|nr:hypothetical protein [Rhodopseudomonas palustris]